MVVDHAKLAAVYGSDATIHSVLSGEIPPPTEMAPLYSRLNEMIAVSAEGFSSVLTVDTADPACLPHAAAAPLLPSISLCLHPAPPVSINAEHTPGVVPRYAG